MHAPSPVLIRQYGLSPTAFSLLFALNALGIVVAAILNPRLHAARGVQAPTAAPTLVTPW